MDHLGILIPIAALTVGPAAWAYTTGIRAKYGYPLDDKGTTPIEADRKVTLLTNENERLTGQIGRLEERIAVLERIATDPADRTAREIDALRSR